MNKRIIRILSFIMLLCMAGCGSPSVPERDELVTVRATVTKVYEKSMEIRVEKGELMAMPTQWLEGKVEPKEGLILEITATNMVLYVNPSQFAKIVSVEVVGFEEPEDKNGMISARGDNGELPKEGALCGFRYQLGGTEAYDTKYKDWGYYCYEHDERASLVLEICSGEHSTGGYRIRVADLEADEEGNLCVTVEETAPKPGDAVTEAFTYPKVTLLIYEETKMPGSVTVKTTGGTELPFLGNLPPKAEADEEGTAWQEKSMGKDDY